MIDSWIDTQSGKVSSEQEHQAHEQRSRMGKWFVITDTKRVIEHEIEQVNTNHFQGANQDSIGFAGHNALSVTRPILAVSETLFLTLFL